MVIEIRRRMLCFDINNFTQVLNFSDFKVSSAVDLQFSFYFHKAVDY